MKDYKSACELVRAALFLVIMSYSPYLWLRWFKAMVSEKKMIFRWPIGKQEEELWLFLSCAIKMIIFMAIIECQLCGPPC